MKKQLPGVQHEGEYSCNRRESGTNSIDKDMAYDIITLYELYGQRNESSRKLQMKSKLGAVIPGGKAVKMRLFKSNVVSIH